MLKELMRRLLQRQQTLLPKSSPVPRSPVPSKLAVLLFYVSCICCVLGTIIVTNACFYLHGQDRRDILLMGVALCVLGVVLAVVMNAMNRREHELFVNYMRAKAEEMCEAANSRQNFRMNDDKFPLDANSPNLVR